MIGMAKACKGGGALSNYVMKDEKGYELCRNGLSGSTPREITDEMKIIQDLNQRAEKRTFSMVISPDKKEGQKLSNKKLEKITKDFMNKLGIDPNKQQYIAFVHTEKSHKHIHVIANRVQENGKLISDHHIGKRAQWAGHEVAKENGLISAKEVMIEKIQTLQQNKDLDKEIRKEIFRKHKHVMRQVPDSMETYIDMMKDLNVQITPVINKQGAIQGHRILDMATGKSFKASEVHRDLGLANLMKQGLPFKDPTIFLTKAIAPFQKIAMKVLAKSLKLILSQGRSTGIGY